jgi:hypothetical protein
MNKICRYFLSLIRSIPNLFVVSYLKSNLSGSINHVLTPYKTGQKSENRFVTVKLGKICQE